MRRLFSIVIKFYECNHRNTYISCLSVITANRIKKTQKWKGNLYIYCSYCCTPCFFVMFSSVVPGICTTLLCILIRLSLYKARAKVNLVDIAGQTALHMAVHADNHMLLKTLLSVGTFLIWLFIFLFFLSLCINFIKTSPNPNAVLFSCHNSHIR